jgi:hypothetical protein
MKERRSNVRLDVTQQPEKLTTQHTPIQIQIQSINNRSAFIVDCLFTK